MWIIILTVIIILVIAVYAALKWYPPLGGRPSSDSLARMRSSEQYTAGKFAYPIPTNMAMSFKDSLNVLLEFLKPGKQVRPDKRLEAQRYERAAQHEQEKARVTWFGHSAVLIEIEGRTLFVDPMLGQSPSPVPGVAGRRFGDVPASVEQLPDIDVVLLTHDHYDHLDYGTIRRLRHKVKRFFVPLGVGAHLERWGVERDRITEHDWWEVSTFEGLTLACTPARHFSGRSLGDRDKTLWCSWVIKGRQISIFHSGDSGYGPHFVEIGRRFGPFDLTCMECGQYDDRWALIHMRPEETVRAHRDVRGRALLPIHWGAFKLALHSWTDPIERAFAAALIDRVALTTPRIGEPVLVPKAVYPISMWWRTQE